MTSRSELIDRIVSNVLQQLTTAGNDLPSGRPQQSTATGANESLVDDRSVLVLTTQVITESELQDAQAAGRTVQFAPGTVITPSGREFIRQHQVRIAATSGSDRPSGQCGVLLYCGDTGMNSACAAAQAVNWHTREVKANSEIAIAAADACRASSVVCSCQEPSVVACLLNRDVTLRAAVCDPSTDFASLSAAMNPHVVCIGRLGWSVADLRRLMNSLTSQSRTAPEGWSEVLHGGHQ